MNLASKLTQASNDLKARNAHLFPECEQPTALKSTGRRRIAQNASGMNKTEAEFESWLRLQGFTARFEPMTLRIGNGVRYTPDFGAWEAGAGLYHLFDVKGFMESDAAAKIKVAAHMFPFFKFWLATKRRKRDGGGFDLQEVLA